MIGLRAPAGLGRRGGSPTLSGEVTGIGGSSMLAPNVLVGEGVLLRICSGAVLLGRDPSVTRGATISSRLMLPIGSADRPRNSTMLFCAIRLLDRGDNAAIDLLLRRARLSRAFRSISD